MTACNGVGYISKGPQVRYLRLVTSIDIYVAKASLLMYSCQMKVLLRDSDVDLYFH